MHDLVWNQGRYSERFMLIYLLEVCQEYGVLHGANWRTLRVPDWRLGGQGHPWCHGWSYFGPRKIPWKFRVDIFIRRVSRMGGPSWGYLEDVEGSWLETLRTGSSLMIWMCLVHPKDHILQVSCHFLRFWQIYSSLKKSLLRGGGEGPVTPLCVTTIIVFRSNCCICWIARLAFLDYSR